jgi:hypothetical protein
MAPAQGKKSRAHGRMPMVRSWSNVPRVTGESPESAPRPRNLEPTELGYRRRAPVRWLGPVLLAATGARVALAEQFGAYLDKRELQYPFPKKVNDHSDADEFWFDFVADTGDGFDATYTVAYLLAQPSLRVGEETLPRGQALIFGGDQVYPTASSQAYEDRFKGPFRSAFPWVAHGETSPALYALPGNHDWYDGLTAFLRVFATREGTTIGGWHTAQTRSYFALKLPKRWWLLAIDAQEAAYIDDPQLEYFYEVAKDIQPGDRVIVCTPNPSWVEDTEKASLYDTTDYFLRKVIAPTGAEVSLMLSGDLHHYARYANPNRQLITFGGGGAYLYATHELPKKITVPPKESIVRTASDSEEYALAKVYPSRMRSRGLGTGVFTRLPARNWGFLILLGVLHTMLLLALNNSAGDATLTLPGFLMIAVVYGLTLFFAAGLTPGRRHTKHYVLGLVHGSIQVGMGVGALMLWRLLPFDTLGWPLPIIAATALYGPILALAAAEVVALYLLIASRFGVNLNELFAGQGIQGYKGFLRLHIAKDGALTIYPIGIDSANKRWRAAPSAPPTAPWIEPVKPLRPHLIEPPIQLVPDRLPAVPRQTEGRVS